MQFQLYQALSVLGIKVSTFHSHLANGRKEDSRLMLEKALLERTSHCKQKPEKSLKNGENGRKFNPDLQEADMSTIHEAYQFLLKKYVDNKNHIDPYAKVTSSGKNSRKNSMDFGSAKGSRKSSIDLSSSSKSRKNSLPSIEPLGYNKSRRNSDSAIDVMPQIKVTGTLRKKSIRRKTIKETAEEDFDDLINETEKLMSSLLEIPSPMKKTSKRKRRGRNPDHSGVLDNLESELSSGASSGVSSTTLDTPHGSLVDVLHSSELQARRNSLQITENDFESVALTKHIINRRRSMISH